MLDDTELITKGRECLAKINETEHALSRFQLRLGRLALEFAPVGSKGGSEAGRGIKADRTMRLERYAKEIGTDLRTLKLYRSVAHMWEESDANLEEVPFHALRTLSSANDKAKALELVRDAPEGGWTKASLRKRAEDEGVIARTQLRRGKRLPKILAALEEFPVDDLTRDDIRVLAQIAREVQRLQKRVERDTLGSPVSRPAKPKRKRDMATAA